MSGPVGLETAGAHFCARLSAFKVLSLFFCNSIEPSVGSIARPEISRSAEIFGKDCEVQVTLHRFTKRYDFQIFVCISRQTELLIFRKVLLSLLLLKDHGSPRSTRAASATP
jgi:hypothetical protein